MKIYGTVDLIVDIRHTRRSTVLHVLGRAIGTYAHLLHSKTYGSTHVRVHVVPVSRSKI